MTKLARVAMNKPFIRSTVRLVEATAAGRQLHTWNDLLSTFPRLIGVKTGHTNDAGWSEVAAARGAGVTIYATLLGGETRSGRNSDLAQLLAWGLARYRTVWAIDGRRTYASVPTAYGRPHVRLVAAKPALRAVRLDRPARRARRGPGRGRAARPRGQRLGEVQVLDRGVVVARSPLVAANSVDRAGDCRPSRLLRGPHRSPPLGVHAVIVTVTLNAALDRTLTVPTSTAATVIARATCSHSPAARGSTSRAR